VPVAQPVENAPSALSFQSEPDVLLAPRHQRKTRSRRRIGKLIVFVLIMLFCVGAMGGGSYFLWRFFRPEDEPARRARSGNFSFKKPPGWQIDAEVESRMQAKLALSRAIPRSHLALFYRDYENRSPSESELLDEALKKLRGYFRPLDYEDPFASATKKDNKSKLAGEPAIVVEFQGTDNDNVEMRGQCYMLTRRGYAYWFFTWGPADDRERLEEGWDEARSHFRLLNGREGWKEKPREMVNVVGSSFPYQIDFAKDVWEKYPTTDYIDRADLYLRGFEPMIDVDSKKKVDRKYADQRADVAVLVLPRAADLKAAYQAAVAHLIKHKRERESYEKTTIELAKDARTDKPLLDRDQEVGAFRGHLSKVRIVLDKDTVYYGLIGVARGSETGGDAGTLVVFCECLWDRKDFWDREFQLLIERIRPQRGGPRPKEPEGPPTKKAPKKKALD
jgi:hypothetical protein